MLAAATAVLALAAANGDADEGLSVAPSGHVYWRRAQREMTGSGTPTEGAPHTTCAPKAGPNPHHDKEDKVCLHLSFFPVAF
jgi:hypothetical protein